LSKGAFFRFSVCPSRREKAGDQEPSRPYPPRRACARQRFPQGKKTEKKDQKELRFAAKALLRQGFAPGHESKILIEKSYGKQRQV